MLHQLSRRHFLVSAAAGAANLALPGLPSATAAPLSPALSEIFAGAAGSMTFANYATYVTDRSKVDASRAEHQVYADSMREHDRLVMGGPLLGDNGRPRGLLLVYQVKSKQQAETLALSDPFIRQGAIANYSLNEWDARDRNVALLAAALVPEELRAPSKAPGVQGAAPAIPEARLFVNYVKYVADPARAEQARADHLAYVQAVMAKGGLVVAGSFADSSGALFVYRAQSKDEAEALVQMDPYQAQGVVESSELSEWRLFGLNAPLLQRG